VVDKTLLNKEIIRKMKGISTEVIIFALLAITIVVLAIFFLSAHFGPGITQISKEECKQKIQSACASFRTTGNFRVFREIPRTCADSLGVSSPFTSCVKGIGNECRNLCNSVELIVIPP
jgi:hypothetical protein